MKSEDPVFRVEDDFVQPAAVQDPLKIGYGQVDVGVDEQDSGQADGESENLSGPAADADEETYIGRGHGGVLQGQDRSPGNPTGENHGQ